MPRFGVVCECGRASRSETIEVEREAYEAIRVHGTRFIVKPGHDIPHVERIVVRHATYEVVEKRLGVAQRLAEVTDPRR
jgi:hypothetical protein